MSVGASGGGAVAARCAADGRPAPDGGLSDSGQAAIADLRTCLASKDVLNVYYLIDTTRVAQPDDMGDDRLRPGRTRAAILANSLDQLGGGRRRSTVNWAAGFFSDEFERDPRDRLARIRDRRRGQLEKAITRPRSPTADTNWPEALCMAQRATGRPAAGPARLPDARLAHGRQLDLPRRRRRQQQTATRSTRCAGSELDPSGGARPTGSGIFNALRQSGVVVIGALLATTRDRASRRGR